MEQHTVTVHGTLDAAAVSGWVAASAGAVRANRAAIDAINVFPVADSDTGTNLLHTLGAAADACARLPDSADLVTVLDTAARAAVRDARGNSGMILSQVLRGFADGVRGAGRVGGTELACALLSGARAATAAVAKPERGTMLDVLQDAVAAAARAAAGTGELAAVADAAAAEAASALERTTTQLEPLARAGVVDAGGHGVVLLLEELAAAAGGGTRTPGRPRGEPGRTPAAGPTGNGTDGYGYEVMYRLGDVAASSGTGVARLRAALGELGDCVSVVGDGTGQWRVHVHCDDVGSAVEAGIAAGTPEGISVLRLPDRSGDVPAPGPRPRPRAVVAVVDAPGLARLFRAEGAVVVDLSEHPRAGTDGGDADPETLHAAIRATGAASVTVLPQRTQLVEACNRAAALADERDPRRHVVVIPVAAPAQALAALAVHDPARRESDDEVAMAEAAAATRRGTLLVSDQEALTWVGRCEPGDVLGMLDGEVVFVEPGPPTPAHALRLVDALLAAGGELVTALLGADAADGVPAALRAHLRENHPEVELMTYDAGIPATVLALGAE